MQQDDDDDSTGNTPSVSSHSKQPSKQQKKSYSVADTSVKKISELIAVQLLNDRRFQPDDSENTAKGGFISASDTIQPPSPQESQQLWKYRLSLFRRRNAASSSTNMLDLFKSFATELFRKDKQASILPVSSRHSKFSSITTVKELPKIDLGRMRLYFAPWSRNQQFSLSDELLIQTIIHPDYLHDAEGLGEWLAANEYDARPSKCQTEELKVIGCLLYSNQFINRDQLTKAIIDDPSWNPDEEDDFGFFHLSLRIFSTDENNKISIIFISAELSKMEKLSHYFCSLYDGSNKRYPYCTPFLFVPLHNTTLSKEFRTQLIRQHKDLVGDSVQALTIKGWHNLNTKILLNTPEGTPMESSIKEIVLGLPASTGMVTPFLFNNIEPQVNSDFYLAVFAAENEELLLERLKSLTKDIYQLLAPGEAEQFFIDPSRGITFGGREVPQFMASSSTLPVTPTSSALQLQRLNQLVRSPPSKHRNSSSTEHRSYRQRPSTNASTAATSNMTASYAGIVQTNTRSITNTHPSSSYTSSSTTTTIDITVERRFVHIETMLREQKIQQDEMSTKLDSVDEVSRESNQLIKQLLDDMKISSKTPTSRSKRGKPTEEQAADSDTEMSQKNP